MLAILPDMIVYALEKLMEKRARFKHLEKANQQENERQEEQLDYYRNNSPSKLRPIANAARKQQMREAADPTRVMVVNGGVGGVEPHYYYANQKIEGYANNGYVHPIEPVNTRLEQKKTAQPDTISLYSVFYRF